MVEKLKRKPLPTLDRDIVTQKARGQLVFYHRLGHGHRTRLGGGKGHPAFGSPEFLARLEAARGMTSGGAIAAAAKLQVNDKTTIAWLFNQFRASDAWPKVENTAKNYLQSLRRFEKPEHAGFDYRLMTRADVEATAKAIAAKQGKPVGSFKFISHTRAMYDWAIEAKLFTGSNPCDGISTKKARKEYVVESHHSWTEAEVQKFEAYWAPGTRERLGLALLLYTGQRISDVVAMGPHSIGDDDVLEVLRQVKTKKTAFIPFLPALREEIAAAKTGATFITQDNGSPITAGHASKWFAEACDAAGLPHCTAHGLRHAATARCLEAGATVADLMSIFAYTLETAAKYAKGFDARKNARKGGHLLARPAKAKLSLVPPDREAA